MQQDLPFGVASEAKFTREELAEALRATNGNKAAAARALTQSKKTSITRRKVCEVIDSTPELLALMDELNDTIVDHAEQNIRNDVMKGDAKASRFILETVGRDRGYVKKTEVEDKTPANIAEAIRQGKERVTATQGTDAGSKEQS